MKCFGMFRDVEAVLVDGAGDGFDLGFTDVVQVLCRDCDESKIGVPGHSRIACVGRDLVLELDGLEYGFRIQGLLEVVSLVGIGDLTGRSHNFVVITDVAGPGLNVLLIGRYVLWIKTMVGDGRAELGLSIEGPGGISRIAI